MWRIWRMDSLVEADLPQQHSDDKKFLLDDDVIKLLRYLAEGKDVRHTVLFQHLLLLLSTRHSIAVFERIKSILDKQHRERSSSDGEFGEAQHSYKESGSTDV